MFWSSATNSSNIEAILDQPDVTLKNVLDQEEVLQESRSGNKKLLEYLLRVDNMELMLDMITTEPSAETSLVFQYKHPNIICEILTSDISFTEKIAGNNVYLEKLFHYFRDTTPPLNPLLGSYVCRVLGETVGRKLDQNWYSYQLNVIQIMGFLQSEENIVEWLLNHLGTSAVCDFINKLIINMEGPDMRANLYQWMIEKENFIIRLMEKMKGENEAVHANISRLVGDLLFAFRDDMSSANEADPFLEALRSPSTIEALNKAIFEDSRIFESSIIHGLSIILALLGITKKPPKQPSRRDPLDESNKINISPEIINELTSRFKSLSDLLTDPPGLVTLTLTHGPVKPPLGSIRLTIAKFFAHISTLRCSSLMTCAAQSGILEKLLDLFWAHPWNNFLHRYVSKMLIHIVRDPTPSTEALDMLIVEYDLLDKIVYPFDNMDLKLGYRGHLSKVSEVFSEFTNKPTPFSTAINKLHYQKLENWETFCFDTLDHYLEKQKVLLAGAHPPSHGNHLSAPGLNYDSDPGMQWGGLAAMASGLPSGFESSDTFSSDRFDDEKSKSLFEMFCADKSNSFALDDWGDADDDVQDSNDISGGNASGLGLTADSNLSPDAFTSVERFDSEKSKNLFDMFCNEKASTFTVDDPWDDDYNEVSEIAKNDIVQGIALTSLNDSSDVAAKFGESKSISFEVFDSPTHVLDDEEWSDWELKQPITKENADNYPSENPTSPKQITEDDFGSEWSDGAFGLPDGTPPDNQAKRDIEKGGDSEGDDWGDGSLFENDCRFSESTNSNNWGSAIEHQKETPAEQEKQDVDWNDWGPTVSQTAENSSVNSSGNDTAANSSANISGKDKSFKNVHTGDDIEFGVDWNNKSFGLPEETTFFDPEKIVGNQTIESGIPNFFPNQDVQEESDTISYMSADDILVLPDDSENASDRDPTLEEGPVNPGHPANNAQISYWGQPDAENKFGNQDWNSEASRLHKGGEDADNFTPQEKWADFDSFKEALNNTNTQVPIKEIEQSEYPVEVAYNSSQSPEFDSAKTIINEVKEAD